jgi:hypothetical protein
MGVNRRSSTARLVNRPLKCQPVDDLREPFASDSAIHHPVSQFSDVSENRSTSARVRAICDHAWTQKAAPAALIEGMRQKLSAFEFAKSMGIRSHFAYAREPPSARSNRHASPSLRGARGILAGRANYPDGPVL